MRLFLTLTACVLLFGYFMQPCLADLNSKASFTVQIPPVIKVEGLGLSSSDQTHGLPQTGSVAFDMIVNNSNTFDSWELTTSTPIGLSISYNTDGTIVAAFVSMHRESDNYTIPNDDISIYPSKVSFNKSDFGGDTQRIFHFNPIIKVSKNTPPGKYVGNITFTILGEE